MSGTAVLGTVAAAVLAGNYFAWRGIKPREFFRTSPGEKNKKPIKVEITEEGDNIILKCSNVPIESLAISDDREEVEGRLQLAKESAHDFEEIKRQLQKEEAEKEEKKRQELVTPPQARWEAPTPSQAEEQRCNVKFTIKKRAAKVSVAESVLSEWENITITIPHEGEEDETLDPETNGEQYAKVIKTLKALFPKFKNGKIDLDGESNPQFVEQLLTVAVKRKEENKDDSLLDIYFEMLGQGNINDLVLVEKRHLELLKEKKKYDAISDNAARMARNIKIIIAVSVITVVVVAALWLFVPPVGAAISGFVSETAMPIIIATASNYIFSIFTVQGSGFLVNMFALTAALGTVTAIIGFGKNFFEKLFHLVIKPATEVEKNLKEIEEDIRAVEEVEEGLRIEIEEKVEEKGVFQVLDAIDPDIEEKAAVLKLSNIGHAGVIILCNHLRENKVPCYQEIDFTGTPINNKDAEVIRSALKKNFTITKLSGMGAAESAEIKQALSVNKFLNGMLSDLQITSLFVGAGVRAFKAAIIEKTGDINTYKKIISFSEVLEELNSIDETDEKSHNEKVRIRLQELYKQLSTIFPTNAPTDTLTKFKENLRKAIFVSRVKEAGSAFDNLECIEGCDKHSYEELRNKLEKHSTTLKTKGDAESAAKLDEMLEKGWEDDLERRYPCLLQPSRKAAMGFDPAIKALIKEISEHHGLLSSAFVEKVCAKTSKADLIIQNSIKDFQRKCQGISHNLPEEGVSSEIVPSISEQPKKEEKIHMEKPGFGITTVS